MKWIVMFSTECRYLTPGKIYWSDHDVVMDDENTRIVINPYGPCAHIESSWLEIDQREVTR